VHRIQRHPNRHKKARLNTIKHKPNNLKMPQIFKLNFRTSIIKNKKQPQLQKIFLFHLEIEKKKKKKKLFPNLKRAQKHMNQKHQDAQNPNQPS